LSLGVGPQAEDGGPARVCEYQPQNKKPKKNKAGSGGLISHRSYKKRMERLQVNTNH
jgi:hypothetical protein